MKFAKINVASIILFSALSAFAWKNMPDIVGEATATVESSSVTDVINNSLAAVATGVQDPNKDRNQNFEQQENAFIATWTATEASFYYGSPKADKTKKAEFVKAVCAALKAQKGKEQKIFLLSLLQNCPDDASLATLQAAMGDKDKDVADAARMALQQNPSANKILAKVKSKDKVLKAGVINGMATRAYDGKKIPKSVKGIQASKKNNVKFEDFKKSPEFGASLIAGRNWDEANGLEEFAEEFYKKPDASVASKAISSGNDREFVVVAPYAFSKFTNLQQAVKDRYSKNDGVVRAWVLTAIGDRPSDAGRDFIIDALKNTKDIDERRGGAWALACIGDEASAMAALQLHKAVWDDGQPANLRSLVEYAVGACKASKAVDKAIFDAAKAMDRSALRLVVARGIYEALPCAMEAIKANKERGDACYIIENMGMEKELYELCEYAISSKDNWLCGRILPVTQAVARRLDDKQAADVMAKLEGFKAKAEAAGVKAPWDRAIEMAKYKGILPKKR